MSGASATRAYDVDEPPESTAMIPVSPRQPDSIDETASCRQLPGMIDCARTLTTVDESLRTMSEYGSAVKRKKRMKKISLRSDDSVSIVQYSDTDDDSCTIVKIRRPKRKPAASPHLVRITRKGDEYENEIGTVAHDAGFMYGIQLKRHKKTRITYRKKCNLERVADHSL